MIDTDRYARVFSPFDLAGVSVPHRIFLPAHTTNFGRNFLPTNEHVAYLRERAENGVGLIFVEPLRVHPTSLGRSGGLSGSDPRALDGLRRIVDAVRGAGARIFVQITHTGRFGENVVDRLPAWSPSAIPWVDGGEVPHVMTRAEMLEVIDAYIETANLALNAGFDGIEVHIGHGHLLHQFLSPVANERDDDYGGSFENRLRYPLEVLAAVTSAMAGMLPVGIRTSVDDLTPGGLGPEDQREVHRRAVAVPGIAFVNASVAAYQWPSIGHHVADMAAGPHPYRDLTEQLREVIGELPLLTANRYTTLAQAEETLARGHIDMIGMNRAHMADPALIAKSREGREDEVRPCVAHNFCIGQSSIHQPISCMMNPRVGKEAHWSETPPAATNPQRVLVVGGGPAGMEAARVAALAGHDVTLWEQADSLGGVLNIAGTGHGRADLHRMRDWLAGALDRAGAAFVTGKTADIAAIQAFAPDDLILATGARRKPAALDGATPVDVVEVLADPDRWRGQRIVIWDETGSWATLSAAETLAHHDASVDLISRPTTPLWAVTIYSRMTALERLAKHGVALRLGLAPVLCKDGMLICRNALAGTDETLGPYDAIVHSGIAEAATTFQNDLEAAGLRPRAIGDAVVARTLFDAMHDAHVAARAL